MRGNTESRATNDPGEDPVITTILRYIALVLVVPTWIERMGHAAQAQLIIGMII